MTMDAGKGLTVVDSGMPRTSGSPFGRRRAPGGRLRTLTILTGLVVLAIGVGQAAGTIPSQAATAAQVLAAGPASVLAAGPARNDGTAAGTATAFTPAACTSGTCWIDVNVATLWVSPSYPRPIDQPALANPPDVPGWIAAMTVAQKRWLEGKLETQALYGTAVTVIGHDGTAWTRVAVPSQSTNRDGRGYPGWVPTRQLTSTSPSNTGQTATVRWKSAWLWSDWRASGVTGTKVMQVSYGNRLPVFSATSTYVVVTMIDGRQLALGRQVLSLHNSGTSWGATRANVVAEARKFLGLQYLWAGTSGFGFDCSGFTYSVYRTFGIALPRDADRQAVHGTPVGYGSLLPGDLVFFRSGPGGPIIHVGLYVGGGNMIDAPHTGAPVRYDAVAAFGGYAGARRYLSR